MISMQHELRDKVGHSNRLEVFADVNFFVHSYASLLVALVVMLSSLPPEAFLLDEAAATQTQKPSHHVLKE